MTLDDVLTVSEVAAEYRLSRQYVGTVVTQGKLLKPGRDVRLAGRVWLVLRSSAERLWGHRRLVVPEGYRVCRKCRAVLAADSHHFKPYRTRTSTGLTHVCRNCIALSSAVWFEKNKARLRPVRRAYQQHYRAANPGYDSRTQQRYRLRKKASPHA